MSVLVTGSMGVLRSAAGISLSFVVIGTVVFGAPRAPSTASSGVDLAYTISFRRTTGTIKALNGVQGGPIPTNPNDPDLTSYFRQAGVSVIRFAQDQGFDDGYNPADFPRDYKLTLGDIFPDGSANPDDPKNYRFEDFDGFVQAIRQAGAEPLWEAQYDIGRDSNFWAPNGNQAGRAPRDPATWARVVVNVLRHANEGWGAKSADRKSASRDPQIRYVEFPNEPCGLGGYHCVSKEAQGDPRDPHKRPGRSRMYEDFIQLVRAIEGYNQTYGRDVKVLGLGLPSGEAIKSQGEFLEALAKHNVSPNILIFSYHSYSWPDEVEQQAKQLKRGLQTFGQGRYANVPSWNTEWNWPIYKPPPAELRGVVVTPAQQSAYVASYNAQVKTLMQDYWDEATVYRADRSMARKGRPNPREFFYFYLDRGGTNPAGTPKPAYFSWVIFDRLAKQTPQKLVAARLGGAASPTLLAGRSADGRRFGVLVSHWCQTPARCPQTISYTVTLTDLSPGSIVSAQRYVVDSTTHALTPATSASLDTAKNGTLTGQMTVWSLDYWELVLANN